MNWDSAVSRKIFDPQAEALVKDYLLATLPEFRPPRHPAAWRRRLPALRRAALSRVFLRGYPRASINRRPRVVWGKVLRPDPAYAIRALRYEVYPDYWIPALLYEPVNLTERAPAVLNPNGHHASGKASIYKQIRCANLAKRGVLALNMEFIGMGELQAERPHGRQAYLNLTGLAGVGLFYLALQKGLDVLLSHPRADARRVAVTGLSGGGWQTIVISALDPRVKLSVPVAGYTSLRARVPIPMDIGDLEQAPPDLARVSDYQDLTAMLAPRPALLILNENDDCCFATARARPVIYDAVRPVYEAFGAADRFETYSNRVPGTHNYDADNRRQFYRFLNKHFHLTTPEGDIHTERDILTERELTVGLPANQETFQSLALKRARAIVAKRRPPRTAAERRRLRAELTRILRLPAYRAQDRIVCRTGTMSQHEVRLNPWRVPLTACQPAEAAEAELRVADGGRPALGGHALPPQRAVFAADIFGTGENAVNWQLQMLVESAGARILGIQVAQILACAELAARQTGGVRVHLVAEGRATSLAALLAAALAPRRFQSLTVNNQLPSLALLLEWPEAYENSPALFCFGLLQTADVPDLKALLEDVSYQGYGENKLTPPEVGAETRW
jgi:dienelactone hydrolase